METCKQERETDQAHHAKKSNHCSPLDDEWRNTEHLLEGNRESSNDWGFDGYFHFQSSVPRKLFHVVTGSEVSNSQAQNLLLPSPRRPSVCVQRIYLHRQFASVRLTEKRTECKHKHCNKHVSMQQKEHGEVRDNWMLWIYVYVYIDLFFSQVQNHRLPRRCCSVVPVPLVQPVRGIVSSIVLNVYRHTLSASDRKFGMDREGLDRSRTIEGGERVQLTWLVDSFQGSCKTCWRNGESVPRYFAKTYKQNRWRSMPLPLIASRYCCWW